MATTPGVACAAPPGVEVPVVDGTVEVDGGDDVGFVVDAVVAALDPEDVEGELVGLPVAVADADEDAAEQNGMAAGKTSSVSS